MFVKSSGRHAELVSEVEEFFDVVVENDHTMVAYLSMSFNECIVFSKCVLQWMLVVARLPFESYT